MLSEFQAKEKRKKIKYIIELFLSSDKTINELSKETGISSSSVQRYLSDVEFINEIYDNEAISKLTQIKEKLLKNKIEGNKKGGVNFAKNNESIKDSNGHFIGSIGRKK